MIDRGSIEIIRGVGRTAVNRGKTFGPSDNFDETNVAASVKRLTGVDLGAPQAHTFPPGNCVGVFGGVDTDGKQANVRIWIESNEV